MSGAVPRSKIGASGVIVHGTGRMTWARKSLVIKNAPYTIESPTQGQIERRLTFAAAASRARGQRGLGPHGLPPAAEATMGTRGQTSPSRLAKEAYPSVRRRSFHTAAQLQGMASRRTAGPAYAAAPLAAPVF